MCYCYWQQERIETTSAKSLTYEHLLDVLCVPGPRNTVEKLTF